MSNKTKKFNCCELSRNVDGEGYYFRCDELLSVTGCPFNTGGLGGCPDENKGVCGNEKAKASTIEELTVICSDGLHKYTPKERIDKLSQIERATKLRDSKLFEADIIQKAIDNMMIAYRIFGSRKKDQ